MSQRTDNLERRFIVKRISGLPPEIAALPQYRIEQGYFETGKGCDCRIRIIDDAQTSLSRITGCGTLRSENAIEVSLATARFILESCSDRVEKFRRAWPAPEYGGEWNLDHFTGALSGLVILEMDTSRSAIEPAVVARPNWITDWVEVTNWLTNRHLAHIARDLNPATATSRAIEDILPRRLSRIVLTGGPCSGKSTAMAVLQKEIGDLVHVMPETATIVIATVGAKPPRKAADLRRFQRTIYNVQSGFEAISELQADRDGKKALLLDRGTVDGAAFFDGGVKEFEEICSTEIAREYANYDLVIQLAVPPKDIYEQNCLNNAARSENHEQALAFDRKFRAVWSRHPNYRFVRNGQNWDDKLNAIRAIISAFLAAH